MRILKLFKNLDVRRYATFTPRDFAKSYSDVGTLLNRFTRYLALKNCKGDPLTPVKDSYSNYFTNLERFQIELRQLSNDQLVGLVISTAIYRSNTSLDSFTHVINDLDAECSKRIRQLNFDEILRLLYGFLYVIPGRVSRMVFYRIAMETLVENFATKKSAFNFVQICFYLGIWKKNRHTDALMSRIVEEYLLKYLDSISTIEFCIVCTALYKTSIKQDSKEFAQRLEKEIVTMNLPIDQSFLITFIKSCRHNFITSALIKERVKDLLLISQEDGLKFHSMVHLFAYYAQNLYNDKEMCRFFVGTCMDKITHDYRGDISQSDMRGKDFGTFLWSCGQLNLDMLTDDNLRLIEDRILNKISRGEYKSKFIDLIDSCLSLWILNYKSEKLIRHAFNDKNIIRPELDYRANLLKSCIQIEKPEFLNDFNSTAFDSQRSSPKYMRDKSPNLMKIFGILRKISYDFGIRRNHIVSPINYFYTPGIRVQFENGTEVNLEILESNHLLDDGETPTGMFSLKTRLLKRCGCNVLQINLFNRSDDELIEYMKMMFRNLLDNT